MVALLPFASRRVVVRDCPARLRARRLPRARSLAALRCASFCWFAAMTTLSVGCRHRAESTKKNSAPALGTAEAQRALPPLQAAGRVISMSVRSQPDAELLVPIGTTIPRPLFAVLMPTTVGLRQRCQSLGRAIAKDAFVLCLTTRIDEQSRAPVGAEDGFVASALRAALRVTKRKFGRYVASKDLALVGVDDGADAVAPIVRRSPEVFARIALLDGGFRHWTAVDSARFVNAGGQAIVARCETRICRGDAKRVIATVHALGTAARLEPVGMSDDAIAGAGALPPQESHQLLRWLLDAGAPRSANPPKAAPIPNR